MDLGFYPYGNAKETQKPDGSWDYTCQHGPSECVGNLIEACAMQYHPNVKDWFPFINCIEASNKSPALAAPACAKTSGWTDYDGNITTCTNGKEGNDLMHIVAQATENLSPAHQWTPWVVMNGKPLSSSQLDQELTKLICAAYTGQKPAGCTAKELTSQKLDFVNQ